MDEPADFVAGVVAATRLSSLASGLATGYAAKARGEGRSWLDIAAAVGLDADGSADPADMAFTAFSHAASRYADPVARWRCGSCGQQGVDHGPYEPHPDDRETGHALDCARHAADIRAHDRDRR